METVIKVKGITRRWSLIIAVFALVIMAIETVFGIFMFNYYSGIQRLEANDRARFFAGLSFSLPENFQTAATLYIEEFESGGNMEVQVIDNDGKIVAQSKTLEETNEKITAPDYLAAKEKGNGSFIGADQNGKYIMAGTFILRDAGQGSNGAIRWIMPMNEVINRFLLAMGIAAAFGIILILCAAAAGRYFNRSVVEPIREVSRTARKIALGDFKARLQVKESDEIGELCDTINYMAKELSNAEDMKNDFISSVSHELRTPLTAIKGWGETAKTSVGMDNELVEKGISVILNEADRLQGLVEELLDFSRVQAGRLSVNISKIDIAAIIDASAEMYDEFARQHNIVLRIIRPHTLPFVLGDLNRLKQVFINIIDNAVKYTMHDGVVEIKVSVEEGFIRITVSDTGVGIAAKDIDRVKEKFFKANKTVRGSGIGLAVADEIIKQHKGLLFLESEENVGTVVTALLPQATEETGEDVAIDIAPSEINIAAE